jgi:hypothetical protein
MDHPDAADAQIGDPDAGQLFECATSPLAGSNINVLAPV